MASKIKKGDKVFIISGKDKGKEGEVTLSLIHISEPTRPY